MTSLGYQVLWTRLLASGTGSSTYVFTLILATFLVGLAIGAVLVARRLTTVARPLAWLGAAQLVVAALSLAGMPILAAQVGPGAPLWIRVVIVVLPTTIAVGVTLPMTSNLIGLGEKRVGRDAGALLGANTIGAICGTFLLPFLAIPTIGSPRSVVLLALVNAMVGAALLMTAGLVRRPVRGLAAAASVAAVCVLAVALVIPNAAVADPGATRMARVGSLFASAEDEIASVQAGVAGGKEALWVAGAGMTRLTVDAKLMALMPEFTRPDAQRMLVIAFGMGSSFRTGLASGLTVDGVELVPSVPEMFHFFQSDAAQVLGNPRGHVVIADGRNYVALTQKSYDIVIVDPPPPIEGSGTAVLYAREFYEAVSHRLTAERGDDAMGVRGRVGQRVPDARPDVHQRLSQRAARVRAGDRGRIHAGFGCSAVAGSRGDRRRPRSAGRRPRSGPGVRRPGVDAGCLAGPDPRPRLAGLGGSRPVCR